MVIKHSARNETISNRNLNKLSAEILICLSNIMELEKRNVSLCKFEVYVNYGNIFGTAFTDQYMVYCAYRTISR